MILTSHGLVTRDTLIGTQTPWLNTIGLYPIVLWEPKTSKISGTRTTVNGEGKEER